MIIVTNIKTIEVDKDYWEVATVINPAIGRIVNPDSEAEVQITTEMLRGKVYNINGKEIVISWILEAQKALSLPLELADKMSWYEEKKFKNMSLLEHIKCWWKYRNVK